MTNTEIIPRNPSDKTFLNYNITPSLGVGGRLFISDFLAIFFNLRDYVFQDKFESPSRMGGTAAAAEANADKQIVNNVMFTLGASFFVPTGFRYHTPK
jgi:hypothetical protein